MHSQIPCYRGFNDIGKLHLFRAGISPEYLSWDAAQKSLDYIERKFTACHSLTTRNPSLALDQYCINADKIITAQGKLELWNKVETIIGYERVVDTVSELVTYVTNHSLAVPDAVRIKESATAAGKWYVFV